jgi:hypothetical protein
VPVIDIDVEVAELFDQRLEIVRLDLADIERNAVFAQPPRR